MKTIFFGMLAGAVLATGAAANEASQKMTRFMEQNIVGWVNDPAVVAAVQAQNSVNDTITQTEIDERDATWRVDVIAGSFGLVDGVVQNDLAEQLRGYVAQSGGAVTEIFIMDRNGLNVAASAPTSDYWQGDEEKFTDTFPRGAGAFHFGILEFDESVNAVQSQISHTIADPATGEAIGAITVGVIVDRLQ